MIPMETGISPTLSPSAIIEDMHLNYERHCSLRFLEYVLIHNESKSDLNPRVSAALNLGPTGDEQGNHLFYNIATNRIVKRLITKSTQCPMPNDVPKSLHETALKERMPVGVNFDYVGEENVDEDNDDDISLGDHDFIPNPVDPIDLIMSDDFVPVDDDEIESLMQDSTGTKSSDMIRSEEHLSDDESFSVQQDLNESLMMNESDKDGTSIGPTEDEIFPTQEDIPDDKSNAVKEEHIRKEDDSESNVTEGDAIRKNDVEDYMNEKYGKRHHTFNLRPRKMRNYRHLFTQIGLKAGIKKYGSAAEEAVLKEFFQLDKYDCLEPRSDLTPDQKRMALEYLMNIKKKRNGRVKARGCAHGRKQQFAY